LVAEKLAPSQKSVLIAAALETLKRDEWGLREAAATMWGNRVFTDAEVAAMRADELEGEEG
jgi:hypothetical protein